MDPACHYPSHTVCVSVPIVVKAREAADASTSGTVKADAGESREGSRTDAETVLRFVYALALLYSYTFILPPFNHSIFYSSHVSHTSTLTTKATSFFFYINS